MSATLSAYMRKYLTNFLDIEELQLNILWGLVSQRDIELHRSLTCTIAIGTKNIKTNQKRNRI